IISIFRHAQFHLTLSTYRLSEPSKLYELSEPLFTSYLRNPCEPIRHPRFGPTHVGNANPEKAPSLIIEIAFRTAEVLQCPVGDLVSQAQRAGRMSTQFCQRYQRCSRRVCVRREQTIGKKFRPTISQKKPVAPEFVAAQQSRLKLFPRGFARVDNAREAGQDKRSMKIVGP